MIRTKNYYTGVTLSATLSAMFIIVITMSILAIFCPSASALTYNDLNTAQKNYYWTCMKDNSAGKSCMDLLNAKIYAQYRDCSVACFSKAADYNSGVTGCKDSDNANYFVKGTTYTSDYPQGQLDECYTFNPGTPQEKTILFEYTCSGESWIRYDIDCNEKYGINYACFNGACMITNNIPVMQSTSSKEIKEGQLLAFGVSATDKDGDLLTYEAMDLPQGATFDKNTKQFSFKPGYTFLNHANFEFKKSFFPQFRAYDGKHYSAWMKVEIVVTDINQAPTLSAVEAKQADEGKSISFTLSAADKDNDAIIYHLYWCPNFVPPSGFGECLFGTQYYPQGVSFSTATGSFTWQTSKGQAGVYGAMLYALDLYGGIATDDLVITVNKVTEEVKGCTDPNAKNFNPSATVNDGSCLYDGTLTEHHMAIKSKDRMYFVYEPSSCKTKACPLLFMFHGLNGNAKDDATSDMYSWKSIADTNGFIVAYPDSLTLPEKNYFGNKDPAGKHWDITPLVFEKTQDVEFTESMITAIDNSYDIDPAKVYATGMSYGGYFSYYVAMALPTKIKAYGVHSAGLQKYKILDLPGESQDVYVYWPSEPASAASIGKKPAIILYSCDDTTSPEIYSLELQSALASKGHTPISMNKIVPCIGHTWDKTKNQMQWDFFKNS